MAGLKPLVKTIALTLVGGTLTLAAPVGAAVLVDPFLDDIIPHASSVYPAGDEFKPVKVIDKKSNGKAIDLFGNGDFILTPLGNDWYLLNTDDGKSLKFSGSNNNRLILRGEDKDFSIKQLRGNFLEVSHGNDHAVLDMSRLNTDDADVLVMAQDNLIVDLVGLSDMSSLERLEALQSLETYGRMKGLEISELVPGLYESVEDALEGVTEALVAISTPDAPDAPDASLWAVHIQEEQLEAVLDGLEDAIDDIEDELEDASRFERKALSQALKSLERNKERVEKDLELFREKMERRAEFAQEQSQRRAELAAERAERRAELEAERAERRAEMAAERAERRAEQQQRREEMRARLRERRSNRANEESDDEDGLDVLRVLTLDLNETLTEEIRDALNDVQERGSELKILSKELMKELKEARNEIADELRDLEIELTSEEGVNLRLRLQEEAEDALGELEEKHLEAIKRAEKELQRARERLEESLKARRRAAEQADGDNGS